MLNDVHQVIAQIVGRDLSHPLIRNDKCRPTKTDRDKNIA